MEKLIRTWKLLSRPIYVGDYLAAGLTALTVVSLVTAALGLILSIVDYVTHQYIMLVAALLTFVLASACAFCAGVLKDRELASIFPAVFCGAALTIFAITGVGEGSALLWSLLMPTIVCCFISIKFGILLSAYYTALFCILFYTPLKGHMSIYYSDSFMQRFPLLFAVDAIFTVISMIQYHKTVLSEIENTEKLQEQMRIVDVANKAKSSFLANMSHEIRTPINAILGMDEMIRRESGEAQILSYAADIQSAGGTLLSLINDILDFSKIEEGKMELLPVEYDLSSVINDLANMLRPRAEKKGLSVQILVDESIPHLLYGDEIRIRQCVLNLLTNAVKYTEQGLVTLSVWHEKLSDDAIWLHFCVTDTGIGMKREDLERLFSPFERIEENRNRSIEGTGLGMSIVQQLLALMDSHLDVESVYGEGSRFSFVIEQPVTKWEPIGSFSGHYETGAPEAAYHELFCAPEARILVVDDTPVNLAVICGLLKRTLIQIDTAASGIEALSKAAIQNYDVIFIDHMMPEMDGVEMLHRLREQPGHEDVPCVALTANAISGAREMYLSQGFSDYLSKPVDGQRLEALLLEYLPKDKIQNAPPAAPPGTASRPSKAPVTDRAQAAGIPEEPELPDWLRHVGGLDVQRGLAHCGTVETYLTTLTIYAKNAAAAADEIEAFWRAGDLENTTTKVHALKSSSRTIGAERLGTLAEKLEMAGKDGDTATLAGELDGLLEQFRTLGEALAPLCASEESDADDEALPLISDEELNEAYDTLRELSIHLDSDNAAYVLDYLAGFRIPESEKERVKELRRAIAACDWDRSGELLAQK